MIIIDKNPTEIIPNIRESYYDTKIITVILLSGTSASDYYDNYVAMLTKFGVQYFWMGGTVAKNGMARWTITWDIDKTPQYSLLQSLTSLWNSYHSTFFSISYYVLENRSEIDEFIKKFNIINDDLIEAMRHRADDIWKG